MVDMISWGAQLTIVVVIQELQARVDRLQADKEDRASVLTASEPAHKFLVSSNCTAMTLITWLPIVVIIHFSMTHITPNSIAANNLVDKINLALIRAKVEVFFNKTLVIWCSLTTMAINSRIMHKSSMKTNDCSNKCKLTFKNKWTTSFKSTAISWRPSH